MSHCLTTVLRVLKDLYYEYSFGSLTPDERKDQLKLLNNKYDDQK